MELLDKKRVKYLVVHHTQRKKDFPAYIKLRHVSIRGWEHIGYHFLIGRRRPFTRSGRIYMGRPEKYVGAHARGYNREAIGICMIGNLDKQKPTKRQLRTLVLFLRKKMEEYNVPIENVIGHGELPMVPKTCPGKKTDMTYIRAMVAGQAPLPITRRLKKKLKKRAKKRKST